MLTSSVRVWVWLDTTRVVMRRKVFAQMMVIDTNDGENVPGPERQNPDHRSGL